jgi:hydrogenase nickel incorporation protein HypA/HybF
MHELSIAMSLLDLAEEELNRRGGCAVVALHVRLGPLSGVMKEALRSAFELAREATTLKAAELVIEDVPLIAYCEECDAEQAVPSFVDIRCPVCGAPTPRIVHGRELELAALEVEE